MRPHELDALAKFTPGMTEPSPESVDVDVDGGVGLGVGQSESHSHSPCASGIYCSRVSGYGSGYEPDGLLAPVNSSSIMGPCACSLESSGIVLHFSNMDEQQEAKRALTLWRADIDLALASASFAVDMLAWIVITAAVSSRNGAAIFAGEYRAPSIEHPSARHLCVLVLSLAAVSDWSVLLESATQAT